MSEVIGRVLPPFRFHGLVLKYRRIYTPRFEQKHLHVIMYGQSVAEVVANSEAVSVIPHTLIDNAAKYSPNGGRIEIVTSDSDEGIDFSVSSYGPKLHEHEYSRLFSPFYRGEIARKCEEEGAGYGLYISQLVAKRHLGTIISFEQINNKVVEGLRWTTFEVRIPFKAKVLR